MSPNLLFISPTVPTPTGHGLGMRAHAMLKALAKKNRIFLFVLNQQPNEPEVLEGLKSLCAETAFHPVGLWNGRNARIRRVAARWPALYRRLFPWPYEWSRVSAARVIPSFSMRDFDIVHVFRLYTAPIMDHLRSLASWQQTQLDVDDLESLTRRRLATVHRLNNDNPAAVQCEIEAAQYEFIERNQLHKFDRLFVCSPDDRLRLQESGLHPEPEVAPNIVSAASVPPPEPHKEFRLLFVGNLGYLPNTDAVLYFCRDILPRVREQAGQPVTLEVAGGGAPRSFVRAIARSSGARLLGRLPDLAAAYARTDAVVVPLRAGGGTRIKVLEAFARGRPVVSTPEGIEGIAAIHEKHALIAASAEVFAEACLRLLRQPALGAELAGRAAERVRTSYSQQVLDAILEPVRAT